MTPRDGALYRLSVLAAAACVGLLLAALLRAPAGDEARIFSAISATGIMACGIAVLMIERMVRDTRVQARDTRAVVRAVRDLSAVGDPDLVRGALCRVASELCAAEASVLLELADHDTLEVTGMRGAGRELGARIPLEAAELRRVLWSGEPALPTTPTTICWRRWSGARSALLVPVVADGRAGGRDRRGLVAPGAADHHPHGRSHGAVRGRDGRAIERGDLIAQVREHADDLEAVVRSPGGCREMRPTPPSARTAVCEAVLEVCDGMLAVLMEPDGAGNLVSTAMAGANVAPMRVALDATDSATVAVFRSLEPFFVADLRDAQRRLAAPGRRHRRRLGAVAAGGGRRPPVGVLVVAWEQRAAAGSRDRAAAIVGLFAAEAAVAIERADLLARLEGLNRMLAVQVEALQRLRPAQERLRVQRLARAAHAAGLDPGLPGRAAGGRAGRVRGRGPRVPGDRGQQCPPPAQR